MVTIDLMNTEKKAAPELYTWDQMRSKAGLYIDNLCGDNLFYSNGNNLFENSVVQFNGDETITVPDRLWKVEKFIRMTDKILTITIKV